jgi:hypothetical protein
VELLNDSCIKWLHGRKITNLLKITLLRCNLEEKWTNVTTILKQAAKESLGEKRRWTRKRGLRK